MSDLAAKTCIPCEGGTASLAQERARALLREVPRWRIDAEARAIERVWKFKDFVGSMLFVNQVAALAQQEGHHPDITINYNKVRLTLSTHALGGLSENDFILAAKIDRLA